MPGVKSIVWTETNDVKMLHALLYYGNISIDGTVADQIAKAMGPNVPGKAIISHIMLSKKKFKDCNGIAVAAAGTKRAAPMKVSARPVKKISKPLVKQEPDIDCEAENDDKLVTPPETPAGKTNRAAFEASDSQSSATTKRSSPRRASTMAKNYDYVNDPFVHMADAIGEDGENIFGNGNGASSEDSAMSDAGFEGGEEVGDEEGEMTG